MKCVSSSLVRARPLLGTFVEICARGIDPVRLECAIEAAFAAVARVHQRMSFHEPQSDIARFNGAGSGAVIGVDEWTWQCLAAALDLQHRSNGLFNVAIAPALERLGLLPRRADGAAVSPPPFPAAIKLLPDNRVSKRHGAIRI